MNCDLYYEAIKADNAYHDALVSVYGERAGDMRYLTASHKHPQVIKAREAFLLAMDAWHKEMASARGE